MRGVLGRKIEENHKLAAAKATPSAPTAGKSISNPHSTHDGTRTTGQRNWLGDFSMRWHFPPRYGKMDAFHSSQSPKSAETSENGVSGSQFVLKAATSFRPRL
jgi:hypothetical protein